jgi:hypothetical protein
MKDKIKEWLDKQGISQHKNSYYSSEGLPHIIHDCLTDITPQWISVEHDLPDTGRPVWGKDENGSIFMCELIQIEDKQYGWAKIYSTPHFYGGKWYFESEFDDDYKVAEYQFLPEPPK